MSRWIRRSLPASALIVAVLALPPATTSSTAVPSITPSGYVDRRGPELLPLPGYVDPRAPEPSLQTPTPKLTLGTRAVATALQVLGVPYRWGGESPSGFDCSGLIRWAYLHVGVDLPHNSHALYGVGREVARWNMQAGDVLFFSGLGHVGLYLGDGRMVHAPQSGKNVEIVSLGDSHYGHRLVGARRMT
jgi:murein DD-endopeptidase